MTLLSQPPTHVSEGWGGEDGQADFCVVWLHINNFFTSFRPTSSKSTSFLTTVFDAVEQRSGGVLRTDVDADADADTKRTLVKNNIALKAIQKFYIMSGRSDLSFLVVVDKRRTNAWSKTGCFGRRSRNGTANESHHFYNPPII